MAKKKYTSTWMELEPGEDPVIIIGGSQGTSGYDSPYTFSGIDQSILDLINLNCDDFDLKDMDTNGDYVITNDEFQAWLEVHPW